jgi:hypothetical protein
MRDINQPVSVQPAMADRPGPARRTAFVLAGGASLGAMRIGMQRALG